MREYMNYTPAERLAWREHLERYPPGDFYTQKLLADILSVLVTFMGKKQISSKDVAPWLFVGYEDKEIEDPLPEEDLILKSLQAKLDNG